MAEDYLTFSCASASHPATAIPCRPTASPWSFSVARSISHHAARGHREPVNLVTRMHLLAADLASRTGTGKRLEVLRRGRMEALCFSMRQDRLRQRVLGAGLQRRCLN